MKIQEILLFSLLVLTSTWVVQYFLFKKPAESDLITNDRSFTAPATRVVAEPLDLEIDFYDSNPSRDKQITSIGTAYGILDFSNDGAVLDRLAFNRKISGKDGFIETITPGSSKEQGSFLVALNDLGNTPYYYDLIEKKKTENATVLIFRGESQSAVILKEFTIYDKIYKIDLKLTVDPKNNNDKKIELRPRLLFSGPFVTNQDTADITKAVYLSEHKRFIKSPLKDMALFGKENPTYFGLEDTYFLNTLISDADKFAKRAYYKISENDKAQVVLQSGYIKEKTSWLMSFYFGPKDTHDLNAVDKNLDNILDYGWFWFISKPLLYLLNLLYSIFQSYGLAIIILTFLIRLLLLPFTMHGEKTIKKQQEASKKLKYIEQKYKDNPEMLEKYRAEFAKEQMSGMLGCLPLLLQIPVFIALNKVLNNAIELYKVPFLWIPDLSLKDPYFIFPALFGFAMVFQTGQKGTPQQWVFNILIALVLVGFMSNLSAGLMIFMSVSMILGVAQMYLQRFLKAS